MRFAAIILAAGYARRFGAQKLIAPWRGQPMILSTLQAVPYMRRIIVLGEDHARIAPHLPACVEVMHNTAPQGGMGTSIACGAESLGSEDGVFIVLGDMPLVSPTDYAALRESFTPGQVSVPVHDWKRGHPVLFPASAFAALRCLAGDRGGHALLAGAAEVAAGPGVLIDIDDVATLAAMHG